MQRSIRISLTALGVAGLAIAAGLAMGYMANDVAVSYGEAAGSELVLWVLTASATVIFAVSLFWLRFRGITLLSGVLGVVSISGYATLVGTGFDWLILGYLLYLVVGSGLKCYAIKI
ncbi:hypothetical protein [Levilactobacillus yiduensis]|uniref:hypothetical protein n=1 Tax=Levilactobacillus yiduensis TaxID=2953880 RepID=UPI000EF2C2A6|nr:hypothetical protein [Levilactobacillus yiduensis]AYM02010.1 hypothetical protein D8911_03010 [Levilactobacillus brevis]